MLRKGFLWIILHSPFHIIREAIIWPACVRSWPKCDTDPIIMVPYYFFCEQLLYSFPLQMKTICLKATEYSVDLWYYIKWIQLLPCELFSQSTWVPKQVIFKYLAFLSESQYISPLGTKSYDFPDCLKRQLSCLLVTPTGVLIVELLQGQRGLCVLSRWSQMNSKVD